MSRVSPQYILDQRAAGWPDIHPEDYCHRCGVEFEGWYTDRETWLIGTSAWAAETGREGICCITCFTEMYTAASDTRPTWRLVGEL